MDAGDEFRPEARDGFGDGVHRYDLAPGGVDAFDDRADAAEDFGQQEPETAEVHHQLALAGGDDGMDFVRTILREAPRHMTEGAVLVLEIGNERAHFEHAFRKLEVAWLETSTGDDQVLLVTRDTLGSRRWS